jgi:U3 small nucleolar RNA-associated protein 25
VSSHGILTTSELCSGLAPSSGSSATDLPRRLSCRAKFLRQSILISRYDTPEFRSLFNKSLLNVQGKIRVERTDFDGVLGHVRKGVKQVFTRLRGEDALEELEIRFKLFTETTLPALMKSAVSSSNTLIVVPSYFDFVRVTGYMRKMDKISFAAISE